FVNSLNEEQIREAQRQYVAEEIERNGGLASLIAPVPPAALDATLGRFRSLLESDRYRRGRGAAGQPYEFSADDQKVMLDTAGKWFERAKPGLVRGEVSFHSDARLLIDHPLAAEYSKLLADRVIAILGATSGEPTSYVVDLAVSADIPSTPR